MSEAILPQPSAVSMSDPGCPTEKPGPYIPRPGTIVLSATPIGNVGDASARLCQALEHADLIAAEDTRRLLNLAGRLGIQVTGRLTALHEHNERDKAHELIEAAREGRSIVVVCDAGMPLVSDPGYRLVSAAAQAGVPVSAIPGPSAALTALVLSGLASDRFCFEGFVPRKDGQRRRALTALAEETRTMIFFESPRRVHRTLQSMVEVFGAQRPAALCRELTKTHEEIRRATLGELAQATAGEVLGEIVLVVAGASTGGADPQQAARQALALADGGMRLKAAASRVAQDRGLRPNEIYRQALALRSTTELG
ncbi:16S rRNA (cytidine(1402)-2'-O)-methyltransferase [Actinomyces oricola]|uniref:16S rRNA (cytidine(1402)-2'-O)-methyltransferase n=1 Tax=Actinomyces oricola TaxID=206043 RepID=UPI000FFEDFD2